MASVKGQRSEVIGGDAGGGSSRKISDSLCWPEKFPPIVVGFHPAHHPWSWRGITPGGGGNQPLILPGPLPSHNNQHPVKRCHHPPSQVVQAGTPRSNYV